MAPMLGLAPKVAKLPWIAPLWLYPQRHLRFGVTEVKLQV
jgi:hypothetical protein